MSENLYYLGTYSSNGFASLFEKTYYNKEKFNTYVVTGGCTLANEMLIKNLANEIEKEGFIAERIVSFLDKNKIIGVIFPEIQIFVFEGGFPQNIALFLEDCNEKVVSTSDCCDREKISEFRDTIFKNKIRAKEYIKKSIKYIEVAQTIYHDNINVTKDLIDTEKLDRFVFRFSKRELAEKKDTIGKEETRLLSAITPYGISTLDETFKNICKKSYVLEDKSDIVSYMLIEKIKNEALINGYNVICCPNSIYDNNSPEHLILPELKLGIFTSNNNHKWHGDCYKKINADRFVLKEEIKKHKNRIKFNCNAQADLIFQASHLLSKFKEKDDNVQNIYNEFTDFDKVDEIKNSVKNEILSKVKL